MPSERQLAANRRNALRSAGPKTEAGRRASSLNALKHGLRSPLIVLPGENQAEFDALYNDFAAEAQPRSTSDLAAVRKIAACEWRLRRLGEIEAEMFTRLIEKSRATETTPRSDVALVARRFLEGDLKPFTALARYEASLDRQYRNAWRELDSRPDAATEISANEPNSNAVAATSRTNPIPEPDTRNKATSSHAAPTPAPPAETARTNPIPESDTSEAAHRNPKNKPNSPALISQTPQTKPIPKTDTPRNAPCPCGSKLKYKRCCGVSPPAVLHFPAGPGRRHAKAS
jgi:SEC-C motif-containing protein